VRAGASLGIVSRDQGRLSRRLSLLAAVVAFVLSPTGGSAPPIFRAATPTAANTATAGFTGVAPHFHAMLFDPEFISGPTQISAADRLSANRGATALAEDTSNAEAGNAAPQSQAVAEIEENPSAPSSPSTERASTPTVPRRGPENGNLSAKPVDERASLPPLFGGPLSSGPALGYAASRDDALIAKGGDASGASNAYDRWTAVYDLARHTVYLPNGARLEAHSGLGDRRDDPRHVNEQNRGATPPHVYELASLEHEQLFHGVRALRLNPVGGGGIFGRTGLLAHTYMLGPHGDSNGCVVFRDYNAFLQAYQTGQVKRLAVVARLD
jgi:hypothetical protein